MDFIFAQQAWAPQFREAFKELSSKSTRYITEGAKLLARTVDGDTWLPHKHLLQYVPNLNHINIVLLEDVSSNRKEIAEKIVIGAELGLVLLGPTIDRHNKPYLIVLTTKWTYYVIDPEHGDEIKFLWFLMGQSNLKIYMSNTLQEADCLRGNFGIDLAKAKANITCATGLHIYMMQFLRHMGAAGISKYPVWVRVRASNERDIKIEGDFYELVEIWLDIFKKRIEYKQEQLIQLKTRPLSDTARNIIKKRCCLVQVLNQVIEYYSMIEFEFSSETIYNTLLICSDEIAKMIREMARHNEPGLMLQYYANLGTGVGTDKYKIIPELIEYDSESDSD